MEPYWVAIVWVLSHLICAILAKRRGLEFGIPMTIVGVILGPVAILIVLFYPASDQLDIENE